MENSNKYDSYFNEEVPQRKEEPKKQNSNKEYKMPFSKPRNLPKEKAFQQPEPPANHNKIIKDVNDLKTMNLEELNQLPYSRNELKSLNLGKQNIEKYESIDQLYETYGNDSDYEVVDLQDLKNFMAGEFDENMIIPSEEQIESLEKAMQEDPQNFNTLLQLIYVYRETNNKEKLKQIREHTAALFPLSEEMWKDWIKDEFSDIKTDDLFKKYEFIDIMFKHFKICKRFLKYLINLKKEFEFRHIKSNQDNYNYLTIENIRKSFEDVLDIWGLDFNQSGKLWDLYLEFENSNLENFKRIMDDANYNQTVLIIRSIYRRRLSFAHIDLDIVWGEYKNWEKNEAELLKVQAKYNESSKNVENIINLEENFNDLLNKAKLEDNSDELCVFLKVEIPKISLKHFNYLRLYFEKALELNPDDENIWEIYIDFAKRLNKNKELTLNILSRACKCCYFNVVFWINLLREMEKSQKSPEEIQKKIQEAYLSAEDGNFKSEIWKYNLEFSCRNFDSTIEQLEQIRNMFQSAQADIEANGNKDYLEKIYLIWIEFEVYKVKDHAMFTQLINKLVKINSSYENWLRFINCEKFFGDIVATRKAFKRAVEYSKEDKEKFAENWISWEKIFGTAADTEEAIYFSKKKNLKRLGINKKAKNLKISRKDKNLKEELEDDKNLEINEEGKEELMAVDDTSSQLSSQENKQENIFNNSNKTVIIKNISISIDEEDLETFIRSQNESLKIEDIRIVRDKKGNSKGFAFVDFSTIEEADNCAKSLNNRKLEDKLISCAVSKPPALGENDKRTIFVNNLPFDASENALKSTFEKYGQLLDIRIIYDKKLNKPKGYGYVEFADEESLAKVMDEKQNILINGRKVIVKRSQSVTKLREEVRNVAYVTNLPFSYDENNLKLFFAKNDVDKIVDCLITKDDSGNSKGFGFVEFEDEESLKKALKLTGKAIRGRCISIQISKSNITRSKKRKSDNIVIDKKDKMLKKKRKIDKIEAMGSDKKNEEIIVKKGVMNNNDFRKFLK